MKLLLQGIRLTCSIWLPRPWVFVFWYSQSVKKTDFEFHVWLCMVRQVPARHLSPQSSSLLIQALFSYSILLKQHQCEWFFVGMSIHVREETWGVVLIFFFFFNESNHHLSDPNQCPSRSPWAFYLASNNNNKNSITSGKASQQASWQTNDIFSAKKSLSHFTVAVDIGCFFNENPFFLSPRYIHNLPFFSLWIIQSQPK